VRVAYIIQLGTFEMNVPVCVCNDSLRVCVRACVCVCVCERESERVTLTRKKERKTNRKGERERGKSVCVCVCVCVRVRERDRKRARDMTTCHARCCGPKNNCLPQIMECQNKNQKNLQRTGHARSPISTPGRWE